MIKIHTDIISFLKYEDKNITEIYYLVEMEVGLPDTGLAEHLVVLFPLGH